MNKLKILFIILVISHVAGLTNAQYLSDQKLKEYCSTFNNTFNLQQSAEEKYPIYAGVASFILPGFALGQLYNEQSWKFGRHIAITGGCLLIGALGVANLRISMGGAPTDNTTADWLLGISAVIFAGNWIWSIVDAVVSAVDINKQIERQRKTGYNKIRLNFAPGIGRNNKPNFNISVCF